MSIFDREPANWKELQNMTGQLFEEIGCEVAISKRVDNVRGAKEIDVYAIPRLRLPRSTFANVSFGDAPFRKK